MTRVIEEKAIRCRFCEQTIVKARGNRWRRPMGVPMPLVDLYVCATGTYERHEPQSVYATDER